MGAMTNIIAKTVNAVATEMNKNLNRVNDDDDIDLTKKLGKKKSPLKFSSPLHKDNCSKIDLYQT